jgi:hypothetical protein
MPYSLLCLTGFCCLSVAGLFSGPKNPQYQGLYYENPQTDPWYFVPPCLML